MTTDLRRYPTGIVPLDVVLDGGLHRNSVALIEGTAGSGKTTLGMQLIGGLACHGLSCLYVSGEESVIQSRKRAERAHVDLERVTIMVTTSIHAVLDEAAKHDVLILILDPIQRFASSDIDDGRAGSLKQMDWCTRLVTSFVKTARLNGDKIAIVNSQTVIESSEAGVWSETTKPLMHMVDVAIKIDVVEGDVRLLRSTKNRFGHTRSELVAFNDGRFEPAKR